MDDLTAQLAGSFAVSREPNQTTTAHPRYSQYKLKSTKYDQESRRAKLLEIQKNPENGVEYDTVSICRRFNSMNLVRKLTEGDWSKENEEEEEEDGGGEDMEVEVKLRRPGRYYKDQLMMSEWLVEVPPDFSTNWMAVLCPVAKRCLVVASRGKTQAFSKSGYCLATHPSHLPGGWKNGQDQGSTILDCLYSEVDQTYYILDLMCWNGHAIYDSETEFRFYWLHEKIQEFTTLATNCKGNPYKFVALPSFRCVQEDIALAVTAATFEIDGLLFFHKQTHYTFGSTPLVVWLKPYMLEEILKITVPETQMSHRPTDYICYNDHVKKWKVAEEERQKQLEEKRLRPRQQRARKQRRGDMEVTNEESTTEVVDVEIEESTPETAEVEVEESTPQTAEVEVEESKDSNGVEESIEDVVTSVQT